jgi:hypothetical protein
MGPIRTDQHPFAAADTPNFLDLLDRVTADEQLDPRRKADLRSAIKTVAQWLGSDLTAMPAHPPLPARAARRLPASRGRRDPQAAPERAQCCRLRSRPLWTGRSALFSSATVAGSTGALRPPARQVLPMRPVALLALHLRSRDRTRPGDRCRGPGVPDGAPAAFRASRTRARPIRSPAVSGTRRVLRSRAGQMWNLPNPASGAPAAWAGRTSRLRSKPRWMRTLPIRSTMATSSPTTVGSSPWRRARSPPRRTTCAASPPP